MSAALLVFSLLPALPLHAQLGLEKREPRPFVSLARLRPVTVAPGRSVTVSLDFRVSRGFHVNSNEPRSDLLIPTQLTLKAPNDLLLGPITYPAGKDMTFPFAPDEPLSVYEGDFTITVLVRAASAAGTGTHRIRGELKYQACDDKACYPPAALPVNIDVRVQRSTRRLR